MNIPESKEKQVGFSGMFWAASSCRVGRFICDLLFKDSISFSTFCLDSKNLKNMIFLVKL